MQLWVLLITALVPLAIAPGLVSAFDITPKIAIFLFCESALLVFCKNFVSGSRTLLQSMAGKLFAALLVGQLASMILSTLWSTNVSLSVYGSGWRREGLIVDSAILIFTWIVAVWLAEDAGRLRALLRVAAGAGAVGALYGIVQYFGWDPFLPSVAYQSGEGPFTIVRPPGTLGHADYFANWLVMIVFLALYLGKLEDDGRAKARAWIAALLAAFAIVLSGTRSALAGLMVGAAVCFVISRPKVNLRGLVAAATCVAGLAVLYVSPAGAKLRARVHWSMDDVYGGARLLLWRDSLQMAKEHPLLGFGPETFTTQFPRFESVALSRAYPDFYQESPHNMFLDVLTSARSAGSGDPDRIVFLCVVARQKERRAIGGAGGSDGLSAIHGVDGSYGTLFLFADGIRGGFAGGDLGEWGKKSPTDGPDCFCLWIGVDFCGVRDPTDGRRRCDGFGRAEYCGGRCRRCDEVLPDGSTLGGFSWGSGFELFAGDGSFGGLDHRLGERRRGRAAGYRCGGSCYADRRGSAKRLV